MWSIHMEHYSTLRKKDIRPPATWMDLGDTVLSEVTLTKRQTRGSMYTLEPSFIETER